MKNSSAIRRGRARSRSAGLTIPELLAVVLLGAIGALVGAACHWVVANKFVGVSPPFRFGALYLLYFAVGVVTGLTESQVLMGLGSIVVLVVPSYVSWFRVAPANDPAAMAGALVEDNPALGLPEGCKAKDFKQAVEVCHLTLDYITKRYEEQEAKDGGQMKIGGHEHRMLDVAVAFWPQLVVEERLRAIEIAAKLEGIDQCKLVPKLAFRATPRPTLQQIDVMSSFPVQSFFCPMVSYPMYEVLASAHNDADPRVQAASKTLLAKMQAIAGRYTAAWDELAYQSCAIGKGSPAVAYSISADADAATRTLFLRAPSAEAGKVIAEKVLPEPIKLTSYGIQAIVVTHAGNEVGRVDAAKEVAQIDALWDRDGKTRESLERRGLKPPTTGAGGVASARPSGSAAPAPSR